MDRTPEDGSQPEPGGSSVGPQQPAESSASERPSGPPPSAPPAGAPAVAGPPPSAARPAPYATAPLPPPPPRQPGGFRRGFGLGAGATLGAGLVLTVAWVLGLALLAGLVSLVTVADDGSTGDEAVQTVWGEESAGTTLRSVSVTGPILTHSGNTGGVGLFGLATYGYDVAEELDGIGKADADAVVLELDTPGGTIAGSKAIADAVERYQQRTGRPVVAFVRGLSASGGMYAMAGADRIIADYGTLVGSIGVILGPLEQYRDVKAIDGGLLGGGVSTDGGITSEYFTKGKGKDFGNPWRAITPEERRVISAGMDDAYDAFVGHVAEGRDLAPATIRQQLGAYIYSPEQGMANGLVDEQLGAEEAYRRIAEIAGGDPDDARVVSPAPTGFLEALTSARLGGGGETGDATAEELDRARQVIRGSSVCTGRSEILAIDLQVSLCR